MLGFIFYVFLQVVHLVPKRPPVDDPRTLPSTPPPKYRQNHRQLATAWGRARQDDVSTGV